MRARGSGPGAGQAGRSGMITTVEAEGDPGGGRHLLPRSLAAPGGRSSFAEGLQPLLPYIQMHSAFWPNGLKRPVLPRFMPLASPIRAPPGDPQCRLKSP